MVVTRRSRESGRREVFPVNSLFVVDNNKFEQRPPELIRRERPSSRVFISKEVEW